MAIKITFFTAFKVTIYAEEFCRVFWRFCVRNHSANILTEKTPNSFSQKILKNYRNKILMFKKYF
jgi:L-lysine 2,3-aminomutase